MNVHEYTLKHCSDQPISVHPEAYRANKPETAPPTPPLTQKALPNCCKNYIILMLVSSKYIPLKLAVPTTTGLL